MISAMQIGAYGAMAASQRFDQQARQTVQDSAPDATSGDIVSDFVGQIDARTAFAASISVIKTADEMTGQLLNIKA
ncbi:flagellar basal body rod C-terminal domain-containing protein [Asticcacaulis solisilvae]|uniref:flagellar basal body rod C-terminal domain-containing protein n=1 Tax=Asticcacaulis solisilvae TaxID=1217274 RepID=UPI003FD8B4DF